LKANNIIQILCISLFILNLIGIILLQQYYVYISNALSVELQITILIATIILSFLILLIMFLKANKKIPFFIAFLITAQHIFMLVYNAFNVGDFWQYLIVGFQEITIFSILTIIIASYIMLLLWNYDLLPGKKSLFSMSLKKGFGKLSGALFLIWVYVPIFVGILTPMIIYFPIAYISWSVFSFILKDPYYNSWYIISSENNLLYFILLVIEISLFISGLFIFLYGLIQLTKAKKHNVNIVQTQLYKYIRHPQNLGILIMILPFALYLPGFEDIGIRIADILSWILFCFLTVIICDFEERAMIKRFPNEYGNYRAKTGFFFPQMRKNKIEIIKNKNYKYILRYFLIFIFFILLVIIINYIAEILYLNGIVEIYR